MRGFQPNDPESRKFYAADPNDEREAIIDRLDAALADAERVGMEKAAKVCEAEALIDDERGYYGKEIAKAIRAKGVE